MSKKVRFIVLWSKNPRPLLPYLDYLKEKNIDCYIQYTLNDYEKEELERGVGPLTERIDTFKKLVDVLGKGSVIWRFDSMLLTNNISVDDLLEKVRNIGSQLKDYTEKLVFSYADIKTYKKVKTEKVPAPSLFGESELPKGAILLPNNRYFISTHKKDPGQRQFCECMASKDIGEYKTCLHLCEYCYANATKLLALRNWKCYKQT